MFQLAMLSKPVRDSGWSFTEVAQMWLNVYGTLVPEGQPVVVDLLE
jgi:hypothetical protein